MRAVVFEINFEGHRLHYAARLIEGLASLRNAGVVPVLATSREALQSDEYRIHLKPLETVFEIDAHYALPPPSLLRHARHTVASLKDAMHRLRPGYCYVPYADGVAQLLGAARQLGDDPLPPEVPIEGLMMRGGIFYPQPAGPKSLVRRLSWNIAMRARWNRLHHLDPLVVAAGKRAGGRSRLLSLMPEAVEASEPMTRQAARRRLGIPDDGGPIAGSIGIQDERKGIDRLIQAFLDADASNRLDARSRLLLIGRQSAGVAALLAGPAAGMVRSGRIIAQNRYVDQDELATVLAASDLICTPYPRHIGSASIVVRAAHARRPVLASDFGWCGYIVPRFDLGRVVDVLNPAAFAAALAEALNEAPGYTLSPAGERFVQFHTIENFQAAWTEGIRRQLCLPSAPGRREWAAALGPRQN
jgi:glycosyltransferase involved in cell wall biosynthesis